MNVNEMSMSDIEKRMSEIKEEMNKPEADITALTAEVDAMEARKAEIVAIEAGHRALAEKVAAGLVGKKVEDRTVAEQIEVRSTVEYGKAFVNAIITGDDTEARALLSTNATSGGTIPVPTLLDNEIRNAWEESEMLKLCKQTAYPGNVKVGFEYSASGAVVHVEGAAAPDEETLVLGTVELKAESIKKWITISDEAIESTTIDTLGYIYAELAQKIAEKAEEILVGKIIASPATSTTTAPAVPVIEIAALGIDTIVNAVAELSGKAKNLHIAINRRTEAALKGLQMGANYNIDVFDGLKDKIVHTDALPAFSDADDDDTVIIIGDFGYGAQVNRPNGNELTIKVDDKSLAEKDLVKVVGRQYAGIGVVAPKAFVKINKVVEANG